MKTSPHSARTAKAFTLIELLVVIFIIAILISLLFPAFSYVKEYTRKVQATNDESQIVAAVNYYFTEYQKYPVLTTVSGSSDVFFSGGTTAPTWNYGPGGATGSQPIAAGTNDVLMDVLTNNTGNATNSATVASLNPRGQTFLNVKFVSNTNQPIGGVVPDSASSSSTSVVGAWYDPWGSQYNVLVNSSYSKILPVPYSDLPAPVNNGVIVWAFGRNGALGGGQAVSSNFSFESGSSGVFTGAGDVKSW